MQRWKVSVLFGIGLAVLLISCAVLLLQGDDDTALGDRIDPPLHPISSSSYSTKSKKSVNEPHHHHHDSEGEDSDEHDHNTYRHNYRRRFSDAIKGVFRELISSKNSSTTTAAPESAENNSSRLKRQLDFGSASEEEAHDDEKSTRPVSSSTPVNTRRPTIKFTTRRPIIRVLKSGGTKDSSSSAAESDENKIDNSGSVETVNGVRKGSRRISYRPTFREVPPLSNERYDIALEENPKNFTFEVVQVERKVVRKEDGNIPSYFTKGQKFNIEPRLAKVAKKEVENRPAVVYRKNVTPEPKGKRPTSRKGRPSYSPEVTTETSSSEDSKSISDESGQKKRVLVNLDAQVPYNDRDLSDEDLKDYHDGHETFGSKEGSNFTHTILSRNVAGFLPNNAEDSPPEKKDSLRKRSGKDGAQERKFVIEKGKVTDSSEDDEESPEIEIFTVPGGRTKTSTENYSKKKENAKGDRTSPEVPTSLEDLYRKGHPGVVRAPQQETESQFRRNDPDPYEEEEFNPFPFNPAVDEPPLKFDPASDRFYGNPVPDTKEKLAQSNSPVKVENDHPGREKRPKYEISRADYLKPQKRSRSAEEEDVTPVDEEATTQNSAEAPPRNRPDDRFYYGRVYNPPDYSNDYENTEGTKEGGGDPNYDFVGLDDNFEKQSTDEGIPEDFFDFPGDPNERGFGGFRQRTGNNKDNSGERRGNDYDGTTERDYEDDRRRPPPRRPPPEEQPRGGISNSDYENENNSRENDYGGFGSSSGDNGERTDLGHDDPDNDSAFVQTLKQFDEEIRKLQDEERKKLLHTSPLTEQQRAPQRHPPSSSGYRRHEAPLVITSPGPLENSDGASSTLSNGEDDAPPELRPPLPTPTDSSENVSGEDTTNPNSSGADDEEDEEEEEHDHPENNRSVGAPESSTEKSGEDEDTKK